MEGVESGVVARGLVSSKPFKERNCEKGINRSTNIPQPPQPKMGNSAGAVP